MRSILAAVCAGVVLLCGCNSMRVQENKTLGEGEWTLELKSLAGRQASWKSPERAITLEFKDSVKVFGCAGVNRYFGGVVYSPTLGTIKFGMMGSTMMAGPGLEYERAYLAVLEKAASYRINGNRLELRDKDGMKLAVFTRK